MSPSVALSHEERGSNFLGKISYNLRLDCVVKTLPFISYLRKGAEVLRCPVFIGFPYCFSCLPARPPTYSQARLPVRSATLYLEKASSLALVFRWGAKNAVLNFPNVTTVPPPVNKGWPLVLGRSLRSADARKLLLSKQLCRDLEQKAAVVTCPNPNRC